MKAILLGPTILFMSMPLYPIRLIRSSGDPSEKESDPRYSRYGLAPKSKADYAFLLHDLYHLRPNGIMTIVLPHGVLFRGGEEGEIRKNLIENDNIEAIIGLPANIFFGTGIPTIIMVLRQKREASDVLIIDASHGFIKEGKNNKLRGLRYPENRRYFCSSEGCTPICPCRY
jgi:type I restriction-modification system DNA methylase subunit